MPRAGRTERIVVAGGTGFVGLSLAHYLAEEGMPVMLLARRTPPVAEPWTYIAWDGRSVGDWWRALDGAAGLVNLAGRSVDCIKTPAHQDEILRSRVESTRVLGEAVRRAASPPPVWVQMSTAHIYGDPPNSICTESSPSGYGLAPFVGRAWEEEYVAAALSAQRKVVLRTSFVLGRDRGAGRGALARLHFAARLGLGGRIGTGTQGFSWVHELDLNRLIHRALVSTEMGGVYVASAPHPVSQREFMRALRRVVGIPIGLPAPDWMVRFGAHFILRTDPDLALAGRYVRSERLAQEGFEFRFPRVAEALGDLLHHAESHPEPSVA